MSTGSAKYLMENDLTGIPEGHKRLILNMVSRLRTHVHERPQTKFPSSSEKSPASKSPARKKLSLVFARQALDKKHSGHNMKPTSHAQQLHENYCPLEKDSSNKNATQWRKNLPRQLRNEKCWKIVTEESKMLLLKTVLVNDAVIAITEIILFAVVRWKSVSQYFSVSN